MINALKHLIVASNVLQRAFSVDITYYAGKRAKYTEQHAPTESFGDIFGWMTHRFLGKTGVFRIHGYVERVETRASGDHPQKVASNLMIRHMFDWFIPCAELTLLPRKGDVILHGETKYYVISDKNGEVYRYDNDIVRSRYRIHTERIAGK